MNSPRYKFTASGKSEGARLFWLLAAVFGSSAICALVFCLHSAPHGLAFVALLLFAGAFVALSGPSEAIIKTVLEQFLTDRHRPEVDLLEEVPTDLRTAVAIPSLLIDHDSIQRLLQNLERHYLDNRISNLFFLLLTDFTDADAESIPSDDALLHYARQGILALNRKHAGFGDTFFLFHRPRRWCASQGCWTGWERKRGKLIQLNEFLLNGDASQFMSVVGDVSRLYGTRYVITLDTDTRLPAGSAIRMISAIGDPAVAPLVDVEQKLVVSGFGIMQPRVVQGRAEDPTLYQLITQGVRPPESFQEAPVDMYQCLFSTSPFYGKGIYDVAVFQEVISGRLPNDWVLSHDLLEGCLLRCGALPDIELEESSPSSLASEMMRRHRWVRGDWQIFPWLFDRPPLIECTIENTLTVLSRWRILDNMRRTLLPSTTLLIVLFLVLIRESSSAAGFIAVIFFLPPVVAHCAQILSRTSRGELRAYFYFRLRSFLTDMVRSLLSLAFLPVEACVTSSAVIVSLWRMTVSRRKLLQWVSSDLVEKKRPTGISKAMVSHSAPPFTAVVLLLLAQRNHIPYFSVGPLATLWMFAPAIAWLVSRRSSTLLRIVGAPRRSCE